MVVACCKFLCYFCRTSRANQKAMFEHLEYLLEKSTMLLCKHSLVIIDWLIDRLFDWLIDWLTDKDMWLIDWLIGVTFREEYHALMYALTSNHWLIDWLTRIFDWLIDCSIDWLIDWLEWLLAKSRMLLCKHSPLIIDWLIYSIAHKI